MNIWKIASRWSPDGRYHSSILDIFWKHGIAFIYPDGSDLTRIRSAKHEGDLIAISDGFRIIGIGKALTDAAPLSELRIRFSKSEAKRLDTAPEDLVGLKVRLIDSSKAHIWFPKAGRFCQILKKEVYQSIRAFWESQTSEQAAAEFDIRARAMSFGDLLQDDKVTQFLVPIYQRPYSWGFREVERFLADILSSLQKREKMFAGTVQLSVRHLLNPRTGTFFQEIIDGQQRLTTCALILKAVLDLEPDNGAALSLARDFAWLGTRVSNGAQQERLDEALQYPLPLNGDDVLNQYIVNCLQIRGALESYRESNREETEANNGSESWVFDGTELVEHLRDRLKFVAIETDAGISKTLQIFNTINTAGLDLNGGDLFKVRCFEYLTDQCGCPPSCFDDISGLYEEIDRRNAQRKYALCSINDILKIYQRILIARLDLPLVLARFATETFYERFFDTCLGIKTWEHFQKVAEARERKDAFLSVDEIRRLIDFRFAYEEAWEDHAAERFDSHTRLAFHLIHWSRYDEYWILSFILQFRYGDEPEFHRKHNRFVQELARYFVVFSLIYGKKVNAVHSFVANLTRDIFQSALSLDDLSDRIAEKTKEHRGAFTQAARQPIAGSPVPKNLICRLVECLESKGGVDCDLARIFRGGDEIEHIQSYHDRDHSKREDVWNEWGDTINSLGNLMLLEFELNRSINNRVFSEKQTAYATSHFKIAKALASRQASWTVTDARSKLAADVASLDRFIFENRSVRTIQSQ